MEPRRLPRKVYAPSQHTRDLCGELQDSRTVRGVPTPRDASPCTPCPNAWRLPPTLGQWSERLLRAPR